MNTLKKVQIRRERASFPALVVAFLVLSVVFFLSTMSVREEKAIAKSPSKKEIFTREFALSDVDVHLISLFEDANQESARLFSARHMQRGAAGYLFETDGRWHSIGSVYFSKEEAEKMRAHLFESGMDAKIIPVHQKGVLLRVTADEDTLKTLEFCLSAFSEYEKSLMDLANRLDAGTLSEREARVLLPVLKYDLSKHEASAKEKAQASGENAVKEIFEMYLLNLETASNLTKSEGGEMMLSARVKHAAIESAHKRMQLLKKLAG
ncbi:MAG: hypothetical protein IJN21_11745 [Clostridia bacterium]|nr:hypothetical protein [Clostridiales bacterium]MBQ6717180.1 hypothetical protein [Clostridia bacterium]